MSHQNYSRKIGIVTIVDIVIYVSTLIYVKPIMEIVILFANCTPKSDRYGKYMTYNNNLNLNLVLRWVEMYWIANRKHHLINYWANTYCTTYFQVVLYV